MNRKSNRGPFDTDKGYSRQCPACDWKVTQPNDGGGPKRANDLFAEHIKTAHPSKPKEDPNFDYTDLSTPLDDRPS